MAFNIETTLDGYEYRGIRSGTSTKTGNPWVSLLLEDAEANQVDVTVPAEMQGAVLGMGIPKGTLVSVRVRAVSSRDYSFVRLLEVPTVYGGGSVAGDEIGY